MMRELKVSNSLIGDVAALEKRWFDDGYWFFRDILDPRPIAELRSVYLGTLVDLGVVAPGNPEPIWNGAQLDQLDQVQSRFLTSLRKISPWRDFVEVPSINDVVTSLLGDAPYWLPMVEYRATPPRQTETKRFTFRHQDGYFYNSALPCFNCWVPLAEIDEEIGGVVLAAGMHKGGYLHNPDGPYPYDIESIPDDLWSRSDYRAGDLLLFDMSTPHSGLTNVSDNRFRLSIDLRVMPASGHRPAVGEVSAVSPESICIRAGGSYTFRIDDGSYVRTMDSGLRLPREDIEKYWKAGDTAIVGFENGTVKLIRPPHG